MPQLHRCTWNVNLRNPSQQSVELDHFDTIDCLSLCLYGLRRNTALQLKHLDDRESTSHAVVLFERKISPKSPPSWWPCPMATWCTWCPGNCPQMWHYSRQPPSDWNWSSLYCCTSHGIETLISFSCLIIDPHSHPVLVHGVAVGHREDPLFQWTGQGVWRSCTPRSSQL